MGNQSQMIDISSNNQPLNTKAHWGAGHRLLMRKVSEGTHYTWTASAIIAAAWHNLGGIMWHYHYLKSGISGREQAQYFWDHAKGQLRRYDRVVVDVEAMGNTWHPGEAKQCAHDFMKRMNELAPAVGGVVYGTSYYLRDNGITPNRGWALMAAGYPTLAFIPPGWKTWLAHQFTQTGTAAGISGAVDISTLRISALRPTLRRGDRVFAVLDAKHLLRRAGYRGFVTGSMGYGPGMASAVRRYKRDHHFKNVSGDILGGAMWRHLS